MEIVEAEVMPAFQWDMFVALAERYDGKGFGVKESENFEESEETYAYI